MFSKLYKRADVWDLFERLGKVHRMNMTVGDGESACFKVRIILQNVVIRVCTEDMRD